MKKLLLFFILNILILKTTEQFKPLMTTMMTQLMKDIENQFTNEATAEQGNLDETAKNVLQFDNLNDNLPDSFLPIVNKQESLTKDNGTKSEMLQENEQIVIIGAGPAGCAAATYLARSNFKTIIINGQTNNSQLIWADKVENYPGIMDAHGEQLLTEFQQQSQAAGAQFVNADVLEVDFSNQPYKLILSTGQTLTSNYILIATGSKPKDLNIQGEHEYRGKGVGVCAHCDGPLCEDKETIIIGGNYDMLRELNILAKHTNKITIISKDSDFKNIPSYFKRNLCEKIKPKILFNNVVQEIVGDGKKATGVKIYDTKKRQTRIINSECIFITIGYTPLSKLFKKYLKLDHKNQIFVDSEGHTNLRGIFAAGDVTDKSKHQIITNVGDGYRVAMTIDSEIQKAKEYANLEKEYYC
jgi:thioredoxin reductase (NADPH)